MDETTGDDAKTKVRDLIKDARIAMLATRGEDGHFHARPMATSKAEFDGTLWFLTDERTHKVEQLERDSEVLVTYTDDSKQSYISLAGRGAIVHDKAKLKELWSEPARAWFPKGLEDPNLVAMRIDVEIAEYWDIPAGKLVMLYGYLKAVTTGERAGSDTGGIGEHGNVRY